MSKHKKLKPGTVLTWDHIRPSEPNESPYKVVLIVLGYRNSSVDLEEKLWLWNMRGYELHYTPNFFLSFKTQRDIKNFQIIE